MPTISASCTAKSTSDSACTPPNRMETPCASNSGCSPAFRASRLRLPLCGAARALGPGIRSSQRGAAAMDGLVEPLEAQPVEDSALLLRDAARREHQRQKQEHGADGGLPRDLHRCEREEVEVGVEALEERRQD